MELTKKRFLNLIHLIECVLMYLGINAIFAAIAPLLHLDFAKALFIAVFVSLMLVFVFPKLARYKPQ